MRVPADPNIVTVEHARNGLDSLPTHRRKPMASVRQLHFRYRDGLHYQRRQARSVDIGKVLLDWLELSDQIYDTPVTCRTLKQLIQGGTHHAPIHVVVPGGVLPQLVVVDDLGNVLEPYLAPNCFVAHRLSVASSRPLGEATRTRGSSVSPAAFVAGV